MKITFNCLVVVLLALHSSAIAIPNYNWDIHADYLYAPVKLSEADISASMMSQMDQFDAKYDIAEIYPNGVGLSAADMDEITAIIDVTFYIQRDPATGALTGRSIAIDGENSGSVANLAEPASFNGDWIPKVNRICELYGRAKTSQRAAVEQAYLDMVELFVDHNVLPGSGDPVPSIGNGYTWRNTCWKTLRMSHTLEQEVRDILGLSIFYCSAGGKLLLESPSSSTDIYLNFYSTAFRAVSRISDGAFKWQLLETIRLQLDKTILGYPEHPQSGLISIDGGITHHTGHHISYASYSFESMYTHHRNFISAGFSGAFTVEAIERFRQAARSWCWTDTNGDFPVHFKLRPSHPSASISGGLLLGNTVKFAQGVAELTAAYYGTEVKDDLEMAYLAIAKTGQGSSLLPTDWKRVILPAASTDPVEQWKHLQGHLSFNVMGAAVHRGDNWLASVRGAHVYKRGGEAYDNMGRPDHFHVNSMRGSLMLITEGNNGRSPNSADSGYYYEGWDHFCYPNVTNRVTEPGDLLYWRKPAYFSGAAKLTGGADLFDSGVWMYEPDAGTQRKSAFFFDNRITLVTTDINYGYAPEPVITGLIQQGQSDLSGQPLVINGIGHTGTGQWTLPAGGDHTIVDINGNGYYVHPGAPAVTARRDQQQWVYGLSDYYIGSPTMPSFVYKGDFLDAVGDFTPSVGNYTRVFFEHGTAPADHSLSYTVLVKPEPEQLDEFAASMRSPGSEPFTLETFDDYHLFYDKANATYAATSFVDDQSINRGYLTSVSRAGAYIWKVGSHRIYVSCSSSYMDDTTPFVMKFFGDWQFLRQYDTLGATVSYYENVTTVTLPYRQFARQGFVLARAPVFESDVISYDAFEGDNFNGSLVEAVSGDGLRFTATNCPAWLSIEGNGEMSGLPADSDAGVFEITIRATDEDGLFDEAALRVTVHNMFTGDKGLEDVAGLAGKWLEIDCTDALRCGGADLTGDDMVNIADLAKLAQKWP